MALQLLAAVFVIFPLAADPAAWLAACWPVLAVIAWLPLCEQLQAELAARHRRHGRLAVALGLADPDEP